MIYIFVFLLSAICVSISEKYYKKDKRLGLFFSLFAVFVVAFVAGARDFTIGTDTLGYGNIIYNFAVTYSNIGEFYTHTAIWGEPGYLLLNFIIARFTASPNFYYFILGFLTYGMILLGLWKYKKYGFDLTLAWVSYLFLFYSDTLNAMRQMLACSIVFFSFSYFLEKKYSKYTVLMVAAFSCHKSAILGIIIPLIYFMLQKKNNKFVRMLIVIGTVGIAYFYEYITQSLINIGLLDAQRYTQYLLKGVPFDINALILRIPFLIFIYLWYKKYRGKSKEESLYFDTILMLLFVDLIFSQMRSLVVWLYRLTLYFGVYRCIGYARLIYVQKNKYNKWIMRCMLLAYLIIVFVYQVIYQGNNEIYPYKSILLDIK